MTATHAVDNTHLGIGRGYNAKIKKYECWIDVFIRIFGILNCKQVLHLRQSSENFHGDKVEEAVSPHHPRSPVCHRI
jgi:hypothetical protein